MKIAYFEQNLYSMCSKVSRHGAFQSEENRSKEREREESLYVYDFRLAFSVWPKVVPF